MAIPLALWLFYAVGLTFFIVHSPPFIKYAQPVVASFLETVWKGQIFFPFRPPLDPAPTTDDPALNSDQTQSHPLLVPAIVLGLIIGQFFVQLFGCHAYTALADLQSAFIALSRLGLAITKYFPFWFFLGSFISLFAPLAVLPMEFHPLPKFCLLLVIYPTTVAIYLIIRRAARHAPREQARALGHTLPLARTIWQRLFVTSTRALWSLWSTVSRCAFVALSAVYEDMMLARSGALTVIRALGVFPSLLCSTPSRTLGIVTNFIFYLTARLRRPTASPRLDGYCSLAFLFSFVLLAYGNVGLPIFIGLLAIIGVSVPILEIIRPPAFNLEPTQPIDGRTEQTYLGPSISDVLLSPPRVFLPRRFPSYTEEQGQPPVRVGRVEALEAQTVYKTFSAGLRSRFLGIGWPETAQNELQSRSHRKRNKRKKNKARTSVGSSIGFASDGDF
ncbi:hypothetical protein DFH07DRAFT_1058340 [Mycena maculata]|uniref:Uncharacterized protein n=1 Tax=Mycena maculata TaxID=230809 RepID=A0AAD7JQV9_9AGAR|nr:hypothetical protein DFH07DRAFT_1058340 [Mycena maculata]